MAKKNWKEILVITLANNLNNQEPDPEKKIDNTVREIQQELIIRFEKRNGKPATIISNFKGSKSDLKDLAGKLKKHCCTGGSAKDDEILIQGDVRNDVADFLRNIGHKVRGDFKK